MKLEEMMKYAKEYDISERGLNLLESPYQKIKHVTKFRFPLKHLRILSIERSPFVKEGDEIWLLKDHETEIYNYYTGEFILQVLITDETSHDYHRSLKHAFDFAIRILKQAEEEHEKDMEIYYNAGICRDCRNKVGKENLKYMDMWDAYFCEKCYDKW